METTLLMTSLFVEPLDDYLGYRVQKKSTWYEARPSGDWGPVLLAESVPKLRKRIWQWWHQVA